MKRGCLIVLVAVPLIIAAAAFIAYRQANTRLGLSAAPPISHETVVTPLTRVRVVAEREKLVPFLKSFLPKEGLKVPWYASFMTKDPIEEVLPYEVALLGGADYKANVYNLTLFVNERILGPAAVTFAREQLAQMQASLHGANTPEAQVFNSIKWDEGFLTDEPRGAIVFRAGLPLPAGMQARVLRFWPVDKAPSKLTVAGDHLLEFVIDNGNGDLMTLIGAGAKANGVSLDQVFSAKEAEQAVLAINNIRITGNLTGDDEFTVTSTINLNEGADFRLRMAFQAVANAVIEGSSMLETLAGLAAGSMQPQVAAPVTPENAKFKGLRMMLQPYGIHADFKNGEKTVSDGNNLIVTYVFTGFRPLMQQQVDQALQSLAGMQR